jgi:hypothetical protein
VIISHEHKYVFVELPHTGCTAVSRELCRNYAGEPLLRKHSNYHHFLNIATQAEREYFVFSGIRNPMDEAVSVYYKFRTDHGKAYSDPRRLRQYGGWVRDIALRKREYVIRGDVAFSVFLEAFYRLPYDNWSSLSHHRFDYVMRFEDLQRDFAAVLHKLGLKAQRPLPVENPTQKQDSDFVTHYTAECRQHAKWVFGPFMRRWNYRFPEGWGAQSIPWSSELLFRVLGPYRRFRWRYLVRSESASAQSLADLLERIEIWRYRDLK